MKKKYVSVYLVAFAFLCVPFLSVSAQTGVETGSTLGATATSVSESIEGGDVTLYFFHSITCPHCRKERAFLDVLQQKYPELTILRYEVSNPAHTPLMRQLATEYEAERFLGNVPLTFVGEKYFVGYDADCGDGDRLFSHHSA